MGGAGARQADDDERCFDRLLRNPRVLLAVLDQPQAFGQQSHQAAEQSGLHGWRQPGILGVAVVQGLQGLPIGQAPEIRKSGVLGCLVEQPVDVGEAHALPPSTNCGKRCFKMRRKPSCHATRHLPTKATRLLLSVARG